MDNFGSNFKSIFTVSAAALAGSAIFHAAAGTFAGAGANTWYQGGIKATEGGGLTLFTASSYGPGLASHEAGHTVNFIIQAGVLSAGNKYGNLDMSRKDLRTSLYGGYLATGLVGIPQFGNDGAVW